MDREINDEINNHYQSNRSCYFFQSNMSLPDSEIYPFLESQCERDKQEFRKHGIFYEESEVKRGNQGICSEIKTIKSNSYMIEGKTYIKKICFITAPITENKKLLENISFTPKFIITLEHSDSTTIIMEKGGQNLRNYIKELDFKGEEFPAHLRTILFNNLRFFLTVLISEGFVYNDIKLENILFKLESKNEFMFIDYDSMFNIKDKNKSDYYIKIFCGDPAYFSPEKSIQFNNKKTDKNFISDLDHEKNEVYAFGLLMLSTFSHSNEMNFLNQVLSPDEKMKKIQEKISKINEKYKVWKKLITLMTCSNFLNRPNLNELNLKFIKLKNKNPESIIEKQNKYIKTIYFDGTINYKSKNENIKFQLNRSPNKEISFFNLENSFGIIFRDLRAYYKK